MKDFIRALVAHLAVNRAAVTNTVKIRGARGSGYMSGAGTWWPPETTTIGEYETVDFVKLLEEIDRFAEGFKTNG